MGFAIVRRIFSKVPLASERFLEQVRKMSTSKLNDKFYENILRNYENDSSINVVKVEGSPACEKGASYISMVERINVFGSKSLGQDYHKILIVKKLPSEEQQSLYRSNVAVENENNAYNKIVPALKKYCSGPMPVPACIYADNEVVVLEDLCAEGYLSVGRTNGGLTLEQCKIVLMGLAKIHAASIVLEKKEPEKFAEMSGLTKELLYCGGDSPLLDNQTRYIEHAIALFKDLPSDDQYKRCVQVLEDLKKHTRERTKELLLHPKEHSVICHGDAWTGNIMFRTDAALKLLDLQQMRYNSVASDLSYLMYVNLKPDVLFSHKDSLLKDYLDHLHQYTKDNGVEVHSVLNQDWLNREMAVFSEYGLVNGLWFMPVFFTKDEDVEISKARLKDTSRIVETAGYACDERLKKLVLGYVRNMRK